MHILNNYSNSVYRIQLENFEKIEGLSSFRLTKPQPLSLLQYHQGTLVLFPNFPKSYGGNFGGK